MITKENFIAVCHDQVELKGLLIIPTQPKAIVQFNCGTGAKKEFYLPFLEYLATHNYVCCLWDYRGSGDSAPENLDQCNYTFSDYGLKDMPTIKRYLENRFPNLPLLLFVHSAGGQQIGLMENIVGYKGMVGVAVSVGYARYMPMWYRLQFYYFFYLFTPLSILLSGFVKAKPFGHMENLPKNVALEWRDWCEKPTYLFDKKFLGKSIPEGHYKNIPFPVHIFWVTDDSISNKRSIPAFWNNVKSKAGITFTELSPVEFKEKSIGHFGFFKKRNSTKFWPMGLEKLEHFLKRDLK